MNDISHFLRTTTAQQTLPPRQRCECHIVFVCFHLCMSALRRHFDLKDTTEQPEKIDQKKGGRELYKTNFLVSQSFSIF